MDYAAWMREQFSLGAASAAIADSALRLPLALPGGLPGLGPLLQQVAVRLRIGISQLHVVGSARFGFSLLDGTKFNPRYSDLDLAIVDAGLYARCGAPVGQLISGPRFPELELPPRERAALQSNFDELSRSVLDQLAYISIAVYPDMDVLVNTLAVRIQTFLGVEREPATQETTQAKDSIGYSRFDTAVRAGLPRFLEQVNTSNPSNASPYLIDCEGFWQAFGSSPTRQQRLDALHQALSDLTDIVEVACCLVGGSFVDLEQADPRDVDLVVFYRALEQSDHELGRALSRLTRKFGLRGIDARFVPCDAEPWLLVKLTSFFTSLYHADRDLPVHQRGLVLLLPDVLSDNKQPRGHHNRPMQVRSPLLHSSEAQG